MPNMGYVRFENTLRDLEDCEEALDSGTPLSDRERRAAKNLIEVAARVAEAELPPLEKDQ